MILLKKIMNHFIQKQKLNLNLKNFSFLNSDISQNNMSHTKLYKTILTSKEFIDEQENIEMLKVYLNSKKIINTLNFFLRKCKWKKAIDYDINHDLFLNDLDDFPEDQRINLLENNTIYKFRLSDLVNYWVICLTNSQNLFSKPLNLKNPHTNIEISYHNLINIYIKLLYSHFNIPLCIHAFYLSNMSLDEFSYRYYGILKEKSIENFNTNGSYHEKYEQILNLLHDYRKEVEYTTVINRVPLTVKIDLISNLKSIISLYVRSKYSCNPLIKRDYASATKIKLKDFFKDNIKLGIPEQYVVQYIPLSERRRTSVISPPHPPPEALRRRRPLLPPPLPPPHLPPLETIRETNTNSNNIINQYIIEPINQNIEELTETVEEPIEEPIEEVIEEIEELINQSDSDSSETIDLNYETDSTDDEYQNINTDINPFTPTREINRTPPGALSRRRQQMSSSFSLFR